MDSVSGECDGSLDGKTVGFKAKFAGVTLRQEWKSKKENAEIER
ncbi:MAG: hypothetical protein WB781_27060 [Candidatus Sulfotelmatobacter sp.]